MPKCIELLPCDWLISSLCYQAIEQVYIIKWSMSVYIKHTMNVYLKAVINYFKVHYINKLHRTCCYFISVCVYLYFVFESVQVINGSQTGAAGASVCVCVCVCLQGAAVCRCVWVLLSLGGRCFPATGRTWAHVAGGTDTPSYRRAGDDRTRSALETLLRTGSLCDWMVMSNILVQNAVTRLYMLMHLHSAC